MDAALEKQKKNIGELTTKSIAKQDVYEKTLETFNLLKEVLGQITIDYNQKLNDVDKRLLFEYKDKGVFDAEIKAASDVLYFSMHTNVFEFNREHSIWKTSYVSENKHNSYCGIISIYNFLADSVKYNRTDDLGYLIGRIFINKDQHYFVEGKRQLGFLYNDFGKAVINRDSLCEIVETALGYAFEFDLLVPPYDQVKIASLAQMQYKIEFSKIQTGKRLGFQFNSDDVS
ncbi:MAG: hypothetical protein K9H64_11510 [Bacteroidales bacterium]|nr:hypothetical protein [Bacteroidales bacterium]MCF8456618.1 hypothetical protein [Bacteroidales bacterium]